MGAPTGNQFWKLREHHGRKRKFESAEQLWEEAEDYFLWCRANPLESSEIVKGRFVEYGEVDGEKVQIVKHHELVTVPLMRAFTLMGLCVYMGVNVHYFTDLKKSFEGKEDDEAKDFSYIITRIEHIIFTQKFEGAAAGLLKENLIARDLGLTDKKEVKGDINVTQIKGMEIK